MYSYPVTKTPQIPTDAQKAMLLDERRETAAPVATTIAVAAISPQRIRRTFPAFASCSWKNGEETVNHEGQNPAKTPDASPTRRIMIVISSRDIYATRRLGVGCGGILLCKGGRGVALGTSAIGIGRRLIGADFTSSYPLPGAWKLIS